MVHITVAAALRTCPPPPASPLANLRLTNPPVLAALVQATPKPITPDPNGDKNLGNGVGRQFITGACLSTADCAQNVVQSCCAAIAGGGATGICSGIAVGNANGKAGCGFGDGGNLPGQGGVNVVPDQGGVNVVPDQGGVNVVPVQGSGPVMGAVMTDDPACMYGRASRVTATSEYADTSSAVAKPSREVSTNCPSRSSRLA